LLGLTAATFAATDQLTALTTSFCVDFLAMDKAENANKAEYFKNKTFCSSCFQCFGYRVL
jgi:hypothetical protein